MFLYKPHPRSRILLSTPTKAGVEPENLYYYINREEADAKSTSEKVLSLRVYHQLDL